MFKKKKKPSILLAYKSYGINDSYSEIDNDHILPEILYSEIDNNHTFPEILPLPWNLLY